MKRHLLHRMVIGAALASVVLTTAAASSGASTYRLKLDFTNADGIVRGNDVTIAGVKAGQVDDLTLNGSVAVISVSLDARFAPLRAETKAIVRPLGLLGNKYVEVIPGPPGGGELPDGTELTVASTTSPTDLDQLNGVFDAPTRAKLKVMTLQGAIALGGRAQTLNRDLMQLRNLAVAAEPLTGVLDEHQAALDRATVAFDALTQKLARENAALGSLVDHGSSVFATVAQHDAELAGLLQHADATFGRLDSVLNGNEDNLAAVYARLPQTVRDLEYLNQAGIPVIGAAAPLIPDLNTLIAEMADANVSKDGPGNAYDLNSGTHWLLRVLATPCLQVVPQGGSC